MNEELKVIISAEIGKLKQGTDNAKKQIKSFKEQIKDASKNVDKDFEAMGTAINNTLKGVGVALAGATAGLLAMSASTQEFRNNQAKVIATFENMNSSAEQATKVYGELYRFMGDDGAVTEATQHLAQITTNSEDLYYWTATLQGVYATFGDSLPIESLTEAAMETQKTGVLTGGLADALNWAGVNEEEFQKKLDKCNSEQERSTLILDTLNGYYVEAGGMYEDTAASVLAQNEAQLKLNNSMAKLGEAVAPVQTALTNLTANVLTALTPYIQSFAENYLPKIVEVLGEVGTALETTLNWMNEHSTLLGVIATAIGVVVAAIGIYNTVSAIKKAMDAAEVATVWALVSAHAAHALAVLGTIALYALIVAAIAAVVAAIIWCVQNWELVRETVISVVNSIVEWTASLWASITEGLSTAWEWIIGILSTVGSWIYDNVIAPVLNYFKGLWEDIVNAFNAVIMPWVEIIKRASVIVYDNVIKPILDYFKNLWKDIKAVFSSVANWFNNSVVKPLTSFFSDAWNKVKQGASNAWNGIKSVFSSVATFFGDIFSKAWNKVKQVFSIGGQIFEGIKEGITGVFTTIVNSIIGGINKVIAVPFRHINSALSKIRSIDILGVQPFTWINTFDIPQIPLLAKGGIVDSATLAVIGERGKEAVVPLENNTEWLDKLAEKINGRSNGNTPIILQIDGKTFAETTIDSINNLTRQRGKLALNLI